jgi:hypothetical protein
LTHKKNPSKISIRPRIQVSRILFLALAVAVLTAMLAGIARAQDPISVVTGVPRVDKLLSQMSLDEKMALIRGASEPAATSQD